MNLFRMDHFCDNFNCQEDIEFLDNCPHFEKRQWDVDCHIPCQVMQSNLNKRVKKVNMFYTPCKQRK